MVLSRTATFGRNPPSVPNWNILGPGGHLRFAGIEIVFGIQIKVVEPRLRSVEHPETHPPRRHPQRRINAAVDQDCVEERLWNRDTSGEVASFLGAGSSAVGPQSHLPFGFSWPPRSFAS